MYIPLMGFTFGGLYSSWLCMHDRGLWEPSQIQMSIWGLEDRRMVCDKKYTGSGYRFA